MDKDLLNFILQTFTTVGCFPGLYFYVATAIIKTSYSRLIAIDLLIIVFVKSAPKTKEVSKSRRR